MGPAGIWGMDCWRGLAGRSNIAEFSPFVEVEKMLGGDDGDGDVSQRKGKIGLRAPPHAKKERSKFQQPQLRKLFLLFYTDIYTPLPSTLFVFFLCSLTHVPTHTQHTDRPSALKKKKTTSYNSC
jgi:hypothetical protein